LLVEREITQKAVRSQLIYRYHMFKQ